MKVWRPGQERQKNGRTYRKVYGADNFCTEIPVPFCIYLHLWTQNYTGISLQKLSVPHHFFFFNGPYHFSAFRVSGHLVFLLKVNFNFFVHCIKQLKGKFKQNVFKRKKRTVSIQIEFWESSRSLLLALRIEREKWSNYRVRWITGRHQTAIR